MIIIRLFIKQIIKDKISSILKIIDIKVFLYGNLLIK